MGQYREIMENMGKLWENMGKLWENHGIFLAFRMFLPGESGTGWTVLSPCHRGLLEVDPPNYLRTKKAMRNRKKQLVGGWPTRNIWLVWFNMVQNPIDYHT